MTRILVCDGMEKEAVDKLTLEGFEVVDKHYEKEELKEKIKDFDVVIVRSATKINKEIIDHGKQGKLKLIIRGGVGVDNIDVEYAKNNGIDVKNTPNASSASVAELAIAHMFSLTRRIYDANVSLREGKWEKKKYKGIELYGKTLGLIGFGRIAKEVAKRADGLGMRVVYTDKLGKAEGFHKCKYCSLENLLKVSDVISLHIPFNKEDGAVIGEEEFEMMKDDVYIINCARGGVVDEKALLHALDEGKVAGAGIDVFENEPNPNEDLINNDKVSVTPHIGGSTNEAQGRIAIEIVNIIENYFPA